MPKQRKWRVLRNFEWMPSANIIMTFRAGEVHTGLPRACREKAAGRIEEIRD